MIIQCEDGLSRELRMKVTVWQIFKSAFFCFFGRFDRRILII